MSGQNRGSVSVRAGSYTANAILNSYKSVLTEFVWSCGSKTSQVTVGSDTHRDAHDKAGGSACVSELAAVAW